MNFCYVEGSTKVLLSGLKPSVTQRALTLYFEQLLDDDDVCVQYHKTANDSEMVAEFAKVDGG